MCLKDAVLGKLVVIKQNGHQGEEGNNYQSLLSRHLSNSRTLESRGNGSVFFILYFKCSSSAGGSWSSCSHYGIFFPQIYFLASSAGFQFCKSILQLSCKVTFKQDPAGMHFHTGFLKHCTLIYRRASHHHADGSSLSTMARKGDKIRRGGDSLLREALATIY